MKRAFFLAATILMVVLVVTTFPKGMRYLTRLRAISEQSNVLLPEPEDAPTSQSTTISSSMTSAPLLREPSSIRTAVNWDVPFTSQAPLANWDEVHQEACEEASVLMVLHYFQGKPLGAPEVVNGALETLVERNTALGFPVDTTAAETVTLLHDQDPSLTTMLLKNPTAGDLKKVLSEGKLVIVPAAGQQLGNPYFTAPGPRYHMLLLRGYTDNGYVITNDPGTKRGKEYAYRFDVLLDSIHDWNSEDIEHGEKVVIVVWK